LSPVSAHDQESNPDSPSLTWGKLTIRYTQILLLYHTILKSSLLSKHKLLPLIQLREFLDPNLAPIAPLNPNLFFTPQTTRTAKSRKSKTAAAKMSEGNRDIRQHYLFEIATEVANRGKSDSLIAQDPEDRES